MSALAALLAMTGWLMPVAARMPARIFAVKRSATTIEPPELAPAAKKACSRQECLPLGAAFMGEGRIAPPSRDFPLNGASPCWQGHDTLLATNRQLGALSR